MIMDKEMLRIVLIGLGISLIVGIYLRERIRKRRLDPELVLPEQSPDDQERASSISINPGEDSTKDFEIEPLGPALRDPDTDLAQEMDISLSRDSDTEQADPKDSKQQEHPGPPAVPELIQLAVIARDKEGFIGNSIIKAFTDLGLKYNDMKIFQHHQQDTDKIEFSVVNMVEPGTFPAVNIHSFRTPGLALFFQPSAVTEPVTSFDEMVKTCRELARRLNGKIWDANKQPLTEENIQNIRRILL